MWIVALFLFGLGVILVITAPISKKKNNRCSATTQGTIVKEFETENSDGPNGMAHVYSYNVGGIDYQITSKALVKGVGGVGSQCTIWYNPKNPKDAQPFHYESSKVYTIILIIGIVLLVGGLVLGGYSCATSSNSTQSETDTVNNIDKVKTDVVGKWNATVSVYSSYTKDNKTQIDEFPAVLEFNNEGGASWTEQSGTQYRGVWRVNEERDSKNKKIIEVSADIPGAPVTYFYGTIEGNTMKMSGKEGNNTLTLKLTKEH